MSILPAGFVETNSGSIIKKGQEICFVFKRKWLIDPVPDNCPDYTAQYINKFPASEYLTLTYNNLEHYLTLKKVFSKDNRKYFIYTVDSDSVIVAVVLAAFAIVGVTIGFAIGQFLKLGVRSPLGGGDLGAGLFMLAVIIVLGVVAWFKFRKKVN